VNLDTRSFFSSSERPNSLIWPSIAEANLPAASDFDILPPDFRLTIPEFATLDFPFATDAILSP
jgi:hypothetical protein